MTIEFLHFDGCPNSPELRQRLHEALRAMDLRVTVQEVDLEELAKAGDDRIGFGSPTILVNGQDLLGSPRSASTMPVCRYYPGGLPTTEDLRSRIQGILGKE